ncbi:MAG: cytochrome c [Deltaproteobacteria bacterium]|nr:cytochrome c [Deltaproteobacteria bacterium]
MASSSPLPAAPAVAVVLAAVLAACGASSVQPAANPGENAPEPPSNPAEGKQLFGALCSGCHGARGDGKSAVAAHLFPAPRDLTRGEYRFRSTASGALPLRADLLRSLALGLPGSAMPGWQEQLTDRQLLSLVLFLETLSPRFAAEPRQAEDLLVPADVTEVAETPATIERGRQLYVQLKCGECHGADGRGDGLAAATAKNSDGTLSHVFDFTYGVYKGGMRPLDVYRTFVTGLDGSPMPSYDQSIPAVADRWALVHYVRSLGRSKGAAFYATERPRWRDPLQDQPELRPAAPPERPLAGAASGEATEPAPAGGSLEGF